MLKIRVNVMEFGRFTRANYVADWVKGLPTGYSYWVKYQAPAMLDEIAVHHEDSAS